MSAPSVIRSYEAKIDDIRPDERAVISKIGGMAVDRHRTIISHRGISLDAYRSNPIVLHEHGRCPTRGSLPVGRNQWIKVDGDRLIAKTIFRDDPYSLELFNAYKDEWMRGWSINVLSHEASPPTEEEMRSVPNLRRECDLVHRRTELLEYSTTSTPSHRDALTLMVRRGIWIPDETMAEAESAASRVAVAMPGLPAESRTTTDSQGGMGGGGGTVKPGVVGKGNDEDDEEDEESEGEYEHADDEDEDEARPKAKGKGKPKAKDAEADDEPPAEERMAPEGIARRVIKKGDRWFVVSEDGSKNLGDPKGYTSEGEAKKRLEQVEYFKHKDEGVSEGEGHRSVPVRTAPYIEGDDDSWRVREPDGRIVAICRDEAHARECLRSMDSTEGYQATLLRLMAEQRARMEEQVEDLIARVELKTTGRV